MTKLIDDKLKGIALTLTDRQAKCGILTMANIGQLNPNETALTTTGLVRESIFNVDVSSCIAIIVSCVCLKKGI